MFLNENDLNGAFLTIGYDDRPAALRRLYNDEPTPPDATWAIYRSNDMTKICGGFATYGDVVDYAERLVLNVRTMFLSPV